MKLTSALLKHVHLVFQLEHDGEGLPTSFISALSFVSIYASINLASSINFNDDILGLGFVAFIYLFILRTQLVGLIILIGIISSAISLILGFFGELSELQLVFLSALEYLLLYGALINVIRRYANIT